MRNHYKYNYTSKGPITLEGKGLSREDLNQGELSFFVRNVGECRPPGFDKKVESDGRVHRHTLNIDYP